MTTSAVSYCEDRVERATRNEARVRNTIGQLSYLPTAMTVAMRFIELGKNLDAGPAEYSRVIESDASLSSKLLALSNSSWFGVRRKVTTISMAVNLLGLANVRSLAISYCMTGLHHELDLDPEDARTYWEAALCKGMAARLYAQDANPEINGDEAMLSGLFQDIALPILHTVAGRELLALVHDPNLNIESQLDEERAIFGMDHAEVGRLVAQRLELPELYVDAIAFHHDPACLAKFLESGALARAIGVAARFPHVHDAWREADRDALKTMVAEDASETKLSCDAFFEKVQKEFDALYGFFEGGEAPDLRLKKLMRSATREMADCTSQMVGQINTMLAHNTSLGQELLSMARTQDELEKRAACDALTGILNREGFQSESTRIMSTLTRYGSPFAVGFVDIDRFKIINDTTGHAGGDFCLQEFARRVQDQLPKTALFGRYGGDEFVFVIPDVSNDQAQQHLTQIIDSVRDEPFAKGRFEQSVTISAGLAWTPRATAATGIEALLAEADRLMYEAKRSGGNAFQATTVVSK